MKVFITGDRTAVPPIALLGASVTAGRALVAGNEVWTGELPTGVEAAAKFLLEQWGLTPNLVPAGDSWEDRARLAKAVLGIDKILFIHSDPHTSRMLPPLLEAFGDALEIVSPELLFV